MTSTNVAVSAPQISRTPNPNWKSSARLIRNPDLNSNSIQNNDPTTQPSDRWKGKLYMPIGKAFKSLGHYDQIIPGWLSTTGVALLVASKGAGKTLALLDQALSLATDQEDWMGFPIQSGWHAIYLCGEFPELTITHAMAWCKQHGVDPADTSTRFIYSDLVPNLTSREDIERLIPHIRELLPPNGKAVIYIDTLQRAASGSDLNSFKEMSAVVENLEFLGKQINAPVVLAAHPPKNGGDDPLGSSVMGNATGSMWEIRCANSTGKTVKGKNDANAKRVVRVTRHKGTAPEAKFSARIESVAIGGEDDHGRPYTGALLVKDKQIISHQASEPLVQSCATHPDDRAVLKQITEQPGASYMEIAEPLKWTDSKGKADRSRAQRAVKRLVSQGLIAKGLDGHYHPLIDASDTDRTAPADR